MNTPNISRNFTDPLLSNSEQQSDLKQKSARLGNHSVSAAIDLELPKIKDTATGASADFDSESLHHGDSPILKQEAHPLLFSIDSSTSHDSDENPSIIFSEEEHESLAAGDVVTKETVTVTPGFFVNTSESTFTAYKLLQHFPKNIPVTYKTNGASIAQLFFSPSFCENLFNRGVKIIDREYMPPATEEINEIKYTLKAKMPNTVPLVGGSEINDKVHIRSEKYPLAEGGYVISHTLAEPSAYLNKLQFTMTITPFNKKILFSFKILFEIKGVVGATLHGLITNENLKELPEKMLPVFIELLGKEYRAPTIGSGL